MEVAMNMSQVGKKLAIVFVSFALPIAVASGPTETMSQSSVNATDSADGRNTTHLNAFDKWIMLTRAGMGLGSAFGTAGGALWRVWKSRNKIGSTVKQYPVL